MATAVELLADEDLVPLADALGFFPAAARPSYQSLSRWAAEGCSGVRLAARRVGGRVYTTRAAVEAFLGELNGGGVPAAPGPHPAEERQ